MIFSCGLKLPDRHFSWAQTSSRPRFYLTDGTKCTKFLDKLAHFKAIKAKWENDGSNESIFQIFYFDLVDLTIIQGQKTHFINFGVTKVSNVANAQSLATL